MSHHRRPLLICYDIADPKRLRRAFHEIRDVALSVQKSVFVAELTQAELELLLRRLADLIEPKEDRVQIFMLHDFSQPMGLGHVVSMGQTCVV